MSQHIVGYCRILQDIIRYRRISQYRVRGESLTTRIPENLHRHVTSGRAADVLSQLFPLVQRLFHDYLRDPRYFYTACWFYCELVVISGNLVTDHQSSAVGSECWQNLLGMDPCAPTWGLKTGESLLCWQTPSHWPKNLFNLCTTSL